MQLSNPIPTKSDQWSLKDRNFKVNYQDIHAPLGEAYAEGNVWDYN